MTFSYTIFFLSAIVFVILCRYTRKKRDYRYDITKGYRCCICCTDLYQKESTLVSDDSSKKMCMSCHRERVIGGLMSSRVVSKTLGLVDWYSEKVICVGDSLLWVSMIFAVLSVCTMDYPIYHIGSQIVMCVSIISCTFITCVRCIKNFY